jgi:hypothetical protein
MDDGLYNFKGCIQIMFFDFLWYGVMAWYFDQVVPGDVGTPLHPLFLFHKSYWFPKLQSRDQSEEEGGGDMGELLREHTLHPDYPPPSPVEPIPASDLENIKVCVTYFDLFIDNVRCPV